MPVKIDENSLYDVPELTKLLGFTERTVCKLLREKKIKGKKLGKKWFITGSSVKAYFESEDDK